MWAVGESRVMDLLYGWASDFAVSPCPSFGSREPWFLPLETGLAARAGSQPTPTLSVLLGEAGSSCSFLTWERVSSLKIQVTFPQPCRELPFRGYG